MHLLQQKFFEALNARLSLTQDLNGVDIKLIGLEEMKADARARLARRSASLRQIRVCFTNGQMYADFTALPAYWRQLEKQL